MKTSDKFVRPSQGVNKRKYAVISLFLASVIGITYYVNTSNNTATITRAKNTNNAVNLMDWSNYGNQWQNQFDTGNNLEGDNQQATNATNTNDANVDVNISIDI